MAGSAFRDPAVLEMVERFLPVLVNRASEPDLAAKHGVTSTPTIVYVDPDDGEPLGYTVNKQPSAVVVADMEKALSDLEEIRALLDDMDDDMDDMGDE